MTWNQWYAFRSYFRASLWIVPFIALLLEQVTFRIAYALDARFAWVPAWPFGLSGTHPLSCSPSPRCSLPYRSRAGN